MADPQPTNPEMSEEQAIERLKFTLSKTAEQLAENETVEDVVDALRDYFEPLYTLTSDEGMGATMDGVNDRGKIRHARGEKAEVGMGGAKWLSIIALDGDDTIGFSVLDPETLSKPASTWPLTRPPEGVWNSEAFSMADNPHKLLMTVDATARIVLESYTGESHARVIDDRDQAEPQAS